MEKQIKIKPFEENKLLFIHRAESGSDYKIRVNDVIYKPKKTLKDASREKIWFVISIIKEFKIIGLKQSKLSASKRKFVVLKFNQYFTELKTINDGSRKINE